METATFGNGCFWCTEAIFQELKGVTSVESGYSGGNIENPTYEQVCTGNTGHAEVLNIVFDPEKISYKNLLQVFFASHDPTTLNRQGNDIGTQYRSVIFYHNESQQKTALEVIKQIQPYFSDKIVTEITELPTFYEAEQEHQDFYKNNPNYGYCNYVIEPKLAKLRKLHADKLA